MKSLFKSTSKLLVAASLLMGLGSTSLLAEVKDKFQVSWTIYVGWMPWDYAQQKGIVDKWAKKYGIEIEMVQVNDYIESINQYTVGKFDGCLMTNMDALTIPAAGGVDSTAVLMGDYSNGNDGIILKDKKALADIKGQTVNLVELSVSHYLLARALETVGLNEKDVKVLNTSDADMVAAYGTDDVTAMTTWNPQLSEILKTNPSANLVFDSSKTPGEIIDMLVVNTETLKDNPKLAKALMGAWFEVMALMKKGDKEALTFMAKASGTDLAGYKSQLDSTMMFYTPADLLAFTDSAAIPETMKKVSEFSFEHGILGEGAPDAEFIGIEFPGSKTFGDPKNIKLRFNDTFVKMAAEGKL